MRKFKIITYYGKSDKKFRREFYEIEILDENDKIIAEYGDEYHDKGMDKKQCIVVLAVAQKFFKNCLKSCENK